MHLIWFILFSFFIDDIVMVAFAAVVDDDFMFMHSFIWIFSCFSIQLSLSSRYLNFICMHHQTKDHSNGIIAILIVNVLFFTCYLSLTANLLLTPTNHSRFGFCNILFAIVSVLVRYLFDLLCFIIFFVKLLILYKDIIQNNAKLTCNCTC